MKEHAHLLVAIGLVVLALLLSLPGLLAGSGVRDLPTTDLTVAARELPAPALPASRVTEPLVPEFAGGIDQNPFTEAVATNPMQSVRLPSPPRPPLSLPTPPPLPLQMH
ncbi:MAG: hypothetical protein ACOCXJ_07185 [Planctomycetota bacterium]